MEEYREYTAETVEEAVLAAQVDLNVTSDKIEYEVVEKESNGVLGLFKKEAKIKVKIPETVENIAKKFLNEVLEAMGIKSEIEVNVDEEKETVLINLVGDDMGVLIGKRGQTLDSLQYLASLVINKDSEKYLKVKVDTENYRERRKETLENLAKNIAGKVKKSHKSVALEPMNPYERRIIHSALQNDKFVETHSEGDEPYRKVIVSMKKGVTYNNNYGRKNSYGNRNNSYGGRQGQTRKMSTKEFHKKYGGNSKDYSSDYKKDYAAYLEEKAAAKASAAENAGE